MTVHDDTLYLDDYLMVGAPDSHSCDEYLQCFLRVYMLLGFPVATDKVDGPATVPLSGPRVGLSLAEDMLTTT